MKSTLLLSVAVIVLLGPVVGATDSSSDMFLPYGTSENPSKKIAEQAQISVVEHGVARGHIQSGDSPTFLKSIWRATVSMAFGAYVSTGQFEPRPSFFTKENS